MPPDARHRQPGPRQQGGRVYCAWQSLTDPGLEIVSLQRNGRRLVAEGKALRILSGLTSAITWRIECDPDWRTRALTVWPTGVSEPLLAAECNGRGLWTVGRGHIRDRITGCVDLHLADGPFCHTLPIRRLGINVLGQEVRVRVAFADAVSGSLRPARHAYTLLAAAGTGHLFGFRDLDSGTECELLVDDFGLVQDQPGRFRMIWCA